MVRGDAARHSFMPPRPPPTATAAQALPTTRRPPGLARLQPLNPYGWSKHLFDQAVIERAARKDKVPPQWAGLKFFNVFGPNEYHKGEMMSLVAKRFDDAKAGTPIRLFKSHRAGIGDGEQSAISFMWTMRSPWCAGCWRPRAYRVSSMSAPERREASAI